MTFVRDRRPARRARELLVAALGAALLLLALGLPALGAPPGPTKLLYPDVSPRVADTATPITFTITYRNAHALPPDYVRVAVGGTTYAMAGSGTDWKAGVVFTVTTKVAAGTSDVRFEARDAERFVDELVAGTVSVGAAPPGPTPAPTPTPTPTGQPAPTPTPDGSTGGGSTGGTGGTGATGGSGDGSGRSGTGTGTSDSFDPHGWGGTDGEPDAWATGWNDAVDPHGWGGTDGEPDAWSTSSGGAGGAASGGGTGTGTSDPGRHLPWLASGAGSTGDVEGGAGSGGSDAAARGGNGAAGGPLAWLRSSVGDSLAAVGLTGSGHLPTLPAVVSSTVLVTTWMAFMLFNKRRRDGEPPAPDDVLHAAAGSGVGMGMVLAPAPLDPEAMMPRWRRPSLLEARKTDPIRSPGPARPRLTFGVGDAEIPVGGERRAVRYAVIPLLDRPDEILATRIGELVAGDEVQVEQRSGGYVHVLCPDGRQGWIHRTTLGDVIPAPHHSASRAAELEPEPDAENALAAMLAARGMR